MSGDGMKLKSHSVPVGGLRLLHRGLIGQCISVRRKKDKKAFIQTQYMITSD